MSWTQAELVTALRAEGFFVALEHHGQAAWQGRNGDVVTEGAGRSVWGPEEAFAPRASRLLISEDEAPPDLGDLVDAISAASAKFNLPRLPPEAQRSSFAVQLAKLLRADGLAVDASTGRWVAPPGSLGPGELVATDWLDGANLVDHRGRAVGWARDVEEARDLFRKLDASRLPHAPFNVKYTVWLVARKCPDRRVQEFWHPGRHPSGGWLGGVPFLYMNPAEARAAAEALGGSAAVVETTFSVTT